MKNWSCWNVSGYQECTRSLWEAANNPGQASIWENTINSKATKFLWLALHSNSFKLSWPSTSSISWLVCLFFIPYTWADSVLSLQAWTVLSSSFVFCTRNFPSPTTILWIPGQTTIPASDVVFHILCVTLGSSLLDMPFAKAEGFWPWIISGFVWCFQLLWAKLSLCYPSNRDWCMCFWHNTNMQELHAQLL